MVERIKNIITSKLEVAFSLEVSGSDLTLINETNKLIYKPDNDLYTNKYTIEQLDKNNNFKFTVTDVFDIDKPEIVINDFHKVVFKRELSRRELEEELDNYGKNQRDINILMKSVTNLEQLIMSKLSILEKLTAQNSENLESKTDIFKKLSSEYQKEIKLILELKFGDLQKLVFNIDEEAKNIKFANEREETEIDKKFKHIKGEVYFCKGTNNGCTCSGALWGDNPYTTDDGGIYCRAALHSGTITEDGGFFEVKMIGSYPSYNASTRNGVTSNSYGSYNGYSIHYTDVVVNIPSTCQKLNL